MKNFENIVLLIALGLILAGIVYGMVTTPIWTIGCIVTVNLLVLIGMIWSDLKEVVARSRGN